MMMPVSFITINYVSFVNEQYSDELNYTPRNLDFSSVAIPTLAPAALISELLQLSEPKPMQFCCRVICYMENFSLSERSPIFLWFSNHCFVPLTCISFYQFLIRDLIRLYFFVWWNRLWLFMLLCWRRTEILLNCNQPLGPQCQFKSHSLVLS